MVPLAWALRAAGHDLLVCATGPAVRGAAQAGLPVIDVAGGSTPGGSAAGVDALRAHFQSARTGLHGAAPTSVAQHDPDRIAPVFARMAEPLVDRVLAVAEWWRPQLIVESQVQAAGGPVAARLGLPLVEHGFGLVRMPRMAERFRTHMVETFARLGVANAPLDLHAIDVAPPSMIEGAANGWPVRFVPYNGGTMLPAWLSRPSDRPRIAITLGTSAPQVGGVDPLRSVVAAAPGIDADFILALGDADPASLGLLPTNVRAAGWVPLSDLLASCAGLIHHGGAGTMLTALACGVPQVVMPSGADRFVNAAALHRRGAGFQVESESIDAAVLQRLLDDDALRRTAREVQAEIAAMPPPIDLVKNLEALVL